MQQYVTIEEARAEAGYIFDGGGGVYAQYIFRTPKDTFYVISERRYHGIPPEDEAVAVIRSGEWSSL